MSELVAWVTRTARANCLNPPQQGAGERLSTVGKSSSSWTNIQRCHSNAELLVRGSEDKPTLLVPVPTVRLSRAELLYQHQLLSHLHGDCPVVPAPWTPPCTLVGLSSQGAGPVLLRGNTRLLRHRRGPRHGRRNSSSIQLALPAERSLPTLRLEVQIPVRRRQQAYPSLSMKTGKYLPLKMEGDIP